MLWMLVKALSAGMLAAAADDTQAGTWVSDDGQVQVITLSSDDLGEAGTGGFAIQLMTDDEEGGAPAMAHAFANVTADGTGEPQVVIARTISTGEEGEDGEHDVVVLASQAPMGGMAGFAAAGVPAGSPWLGVTLGPITPELDAHLNLGGKGVMITNIVEDSPAAKAGLQRFDVVLSIDGKEIGTDIGQFVSAISSKQVGDRVDMKVVRGGNESTMSATLAGAPEPADVKWMYPLMPEIYRQRLSGGMHRLEKGQGGAWELKELKDLKDLKDLPPDVLKFVPGGTGINTQITIENDHRNLNIQVDRDGVAMEIQQEGDGPIAVRRTENGTTTEKSYSDPETLESEDPEAYEIYSQAGEGNAISIQLDDGTGAGAGRFGHGPWMHLFGVDDESREEIHKSIEEARKSFDEAMKAAGPLALKFRGSGPHGQGFGYRFFHPDGEGRSIVIGGPVNQSFKVMPDGSIEVRYQKNDTEVVEVYSSEADLEARNPDLFKKFDEVNAEVR